MIIPDKFKPILERYKTQVPVNLGALANELGLEVFKSTLAPGVSGLIAPSSSAASGYHVKLNRHEAVERQRFTLAHEIAHYLLHRFDIGQGVVDDALYRSALSNRKEVEANKLAAQIIMPLTTVRERFNALHEGTVDERVARLAKTFRVSKQAMQIRLGV